jgi:hypothetical protein
MKGHLNTGNSPATEKFVHRSLIRLGIAGAVRSEQHDAVACPTGVIAKVPTAASIEINDGLDPTRTIQVGPLVGEAQVSLDNLRANGLKIHAARIAFETAAQPIAAILFDIGTRFLQNHPIVEHPLVQSVTDRVAPPYRFAVDHGGIGAHVLALEQRHPHIPGLHLGLVLLGRLDDFTAATHAAQIVDRLAEDRKLERQDIMRSVVHPLGFTDE